MPRATLVGLLLVVACANRPPSESAVTMPDSRCWRYDAILERFDALALEQPDVFGREEIGRTVLGEPIVAARIGRSGSHPRPAVLIHAAQHANEANGTGAIMILAERLLQDPRLAPIVDGLDLWLVPVVNVDGHRHVFSSAPGWEDWRKNARDNDGDGAFGDADGVDLNRNWDHRWEDGPSGEPASRNFKGPRPFSEPETRAIRDLILREQPLLVVDLHSPGEITRPNVIFWPRSMRGARRLGPDAGTNRTIARELAAATETEENGVFCDGRYPSYDTLPKEQCWVYRETGILILPMEISSRFWWEGPSVDRVADRVARGLEALLDRALSGPGLALRVVDEATGIPLVADVVVKEFHDATIGPRRTTARDGASWRLLSPGPATVTVRVDRAPHVTRKVTILGEGWTTLEVRVAREVTDGRRGGRQERRRPPIPPSRMSQSCASRSASSYGRSRSQRFRGSAASATASPRSTPFTGSSPRSGLPQPGTTAGTATPSRRVGSPSPSRWRRTSAAALSSAGVSRAPEIPGRSASTTAARIGAWNRRRVQVGLPMLISARELTPHRPERMGHPVPTARGREPPAGPRRSVSVSGPTDAGRPADRSRRYPAWGLWTSCGPGRVLQDRHTDARPRAWPLHKSFHSVDLSPDPRTEVLLAR